MGKFTPFAIIQKKPNRVIEPLSGTAYDVWKENLPLHKRAFLQTLLGDRTKPFTNEDLTEEELLKIGKLIDAKAPMDALYNRKPNTSFSYDDYNNDPNNVGTRSFMPNSYQNILPIYKTLGRFNFTPAKDGYSIKDMYDFSNEYRDPLVEQYNKMSPIDKLIAVLKNSYNNYDSNMENESFLDELASEVGNAYIGKDGRKIDIKVPKK